MNDSSSPILSWSTLPPPLITKILTYLHPYHKPSIRLINRHWTHAANKVLFTHLETMDTPELIEKFQHQLTALDNHSPSLGTLTRMVNSLAPSKVTSLYWDLSNFKPELLTEVINKFEFLETFTLTGLESTNFDEEGHLDPIISALRNLQKLESFSIIQDYSPIPIKLIDVLDALKLKELVVECDSENISQLTNQLYKMPYLEVLNFRVMYQSANSNSSGVISPNQLLLANNKFTSLKLSTDDYSSFSVNTDYLSSEFEKSLSNPNISNLTIFEWLYNTQANIPTIFTNSIQQSDPILCSKLTRLSLFCIDTYLMEHIATHFPNLNQLTFASPLVLPCNYKTNTYKPLTHLTKLSFKGLTLELRENHSIIKKLMPNVVTVNLSYITDKTLILLRDASYIPLMFPNLRFAMFELTDYKLERLILDYNSPLTWESLYLTIDDTNLHLYNPLIKKCPMLKELFIYDQVGINTVIRVDKGNELDMYIVDLPGQCSFDFNYYRKLD
ncbi:hypothetical protein CONCODRAFT_11300 [Conidiobolus coronatus NRRL 28638]|uniref:F-box domain-containing protein n=1 Tax=Conidiobolus coronatus (strain ATCC 28846 / CBS 209.66 / NRRL 28638) TaxID=796925 RepID=A0A137NVZ5_CONC2|nr:hypothetical protein CONCODRAFT_11300 [Conidiobolus coronatus NRRL 28638]|eukprot:KXN66784.1 hypothetical protein CONCODRAFT_11300 [Conidiobolus coronatus NRRL 28638]